MSKKLLISKLARNAKGGLISIDEIAKILNTPTNLASNKMSYLEKSGWIKRVKRGIYYILPIESNNIVDPSVDDPWILAKELFSPCYIGGWSAAEHWGLTEQIYNSVFVVTAGNIRKKSDEILGTKFNVVRTKSINSLGLVSVWRGQEQVLVSDKEKTIADILSNPDWIGGGRVLLEILKSYIEDDKEDFDKIVSMLNELGNGAACKRLGYFLEKLFPNKGNIIKKLYMKKTKGLIKLDPSIDNKGKLNTRWGIWINISDN